MQSRKDPSVIHKFSADDRHPDLCKQQAEKKFPNHEMVDIKIIDLAPAPSLWTTKRTVKAKQPINLEKSWNKTLLK